ncbi:MAG: diguanylate cyclase [Frankiales bacterium]|jgi:diguanylate cyclase (GGDEF)-like protein|nr:diguanylate cyclase [Frankiales bacterium]
MNLARVRTATGSRLFVTYLVASLLPVLLLMLALTVALRQEATRRGLAEGRSEAALLAQTSVEPLLGSTPLRRLVPAQNAAALNRLSHQAVLDGHIVLLRIRNMDGKAAFADHGALPSESDDEAVEALHGEVVAKLTRLNSDAGETGALGVRVVEVYRPLTEGADHHVVGVLEVYLPYAPIQADVSAGMRMLTVVYVGGLLLLYLVLALISASATRRLRRHAADNARLAAVDTLTGLANRAAFRAAVDAALLRDPTRVAVAVLDLEGFREINETLGHRHGDEVLRVVADRLSRAVPATDQVARLAGDEFAVLMTGLDPDSAEGDASARLSSLQSALVAELTLGGIPLAVEASFGVAMAAQTCPAAGTGSQAADGADLVRQADIALHHAKFIRRPVVQYSAELDTFDPAKLGLLAELRRGIEADQLVLHYQPKLTLADGGVVSVEALVRWARPDGSLLMPADFLDAAESTGLIEPLTDWVLAAALAQITEWGPDLADVSVAVNISARNLVQPGFADGVLRAIATAGVPPSRLVLEITETALLADPETARSMLVVLDRAGVAVSIDDFGHGHTALAYLADLPVRELKIDRGFVVAMAGNAAYTAIVRSMIDLGHNLGLTVVAEGVSDAGTLDQLADLGCDIAQGWLIGHAVPADELAAWLVTRRLEHPGVTHSGGASGSERGQGLG